MRSRALGCCPLWFLPQCQLVLINDEHLSRKLVGVVVPALPHRVADESGSLPSVTTAGDGNVSLMAAESNGMGNVLGLGGRPQVRLIDADAQGAVVKLGGGAPNARVSFPRGLCDSAFSGCLEHPVNDHRLRLGRPEVNMVPWPFRESSASPPSL